MSDVTRILEQANTGDPNVAAQLLPLVYDELRKLAAARLAHERPGITFQATALVHEAFLRLVTGDTSQQWNSRAHFFGAAAEAMRRILLNHARDKATGKRGGDWDRVSLDTVTFPGGIDPAQFIELNDLFERLVIQDAESGEVAKLRIFAGLTINEISEALQISPRTVDRLWAFARAWLRTQITP